MAMPLASVQVATLRHLVPTAVSVVGATSIMRNKTMKSTVGASSMASLGLSLLLPSRAGGSAEEDSR
jgi:hypothetical protein